MKKLLLLLMVAMFSSTGLVAQQRVKLDPHMGLSLGRRSLPIKPVAPATRADGEGFMLQFCEELYNWYALIEQNKVTYQCYLYIPADMATQIAGNQITEITFSCASSFSTTRTGNVFVSEDISAEPVAKEECTVVNSYSNAMNGGLEYQTVKFSTPYTIKENTGFFFGYTVNTCRFGAKTGADYPVSIDGYAPNGFSGFVDIYDATGQQLAAFDMANDIGTNLFLAAKTVGEKLGFENYFMLGNPLLDNFFFPIMKAGDEAAIYLPIKNKGGNSLTTIEYELTVNGQKGALTEQAIDVAPSAETYIVVPAPAYTEGRNSLNLHITKVNGVDFDGTAEMQCLALEGDGFARKLVVEEGTGSWCGWCPRGIVGLDKMSERYPDTFIGIAVHSSDDMAVESYQGLINDYFEGFPSCVVNRDPYYVIDPNENYFEQCMEIWAGQKAPAQVELQVKPVEGAFEVTAQTTFAIDEQNADYRLAFVIVEDGLTGTQTNYYSQYPGELEWWSDQGSTVPWTYTHTARDIFSYYGIEGSIPSTITKGEPMRYTATLPLTNVTDWRQTSVIVLLLDAYSNTVLNAARLGSLKYGEDTLGVEETLAGEAPIMLYNLQGMPVTAPRKGEIMVRQQGGKTTKVLVK